MIVGVDVALASQQSRGQRRQALAQADLLEQLAVGVQPELIENLAHAQLADLP